MSRRHIDYRIKEKVYFTVCLAYFEFDWRDVFVGAFPEGRQQSAELNAQLKLRGALFRRPRAPRNARERSLHRADLREPLQVYLVVVQEIAAHLRRVAQELHH